MKVIKLGGSLMTDKTVLKRCLKTIKQRCYEQVVIVPGGGVFAEQVRSIQKQWKFDDRIAHQMALLSMQQMGLLFKSIESSFEMAGSLVEIQQASSNQLLSIWSPDIKQLDNDSVEANWNITSDSLAAWLATQLKATELILIKSANIPMEVDLQKLQELGIIDPSFNELSKNSSYKITVINHHRFNEYPNL